MFATTFYALMFAASCSLLGSSYLFGYPSGKAIDILSTVFVVAHIFRVLQVVGIQWLWLYHPRVHTQTLRSMANRVVHSKEIRCVSTINHTYVLLIVLYIAMLGSLDNATLVLATYTIASIVFGASLKQIQLRGISDVRPLNHIG